MESNLAASQGALSEPHFTCKRDLSSVHHVAPTSLKRILSHQDAAHGLRGVWDVFSVNVTEAVGIPVVQMIKSDAESKGI